MDGPGCGGCGGGCTSESVGRGLGTDGPGEPLGTGDELGPGEALVSGLGDAVGAALTDPLGAGDPGPCAWQLAISVPMAKKAAIPATMIRPRPVMRRRVTGVIGQG